MKERKDRKRKEEREREIQMKERVDGGEGEGERVREEGEERWIVGEEKDPLSVRKTTGTRATS